VGCIDQMLAWQQFALGESRVNARKSGTISLSRRSCFYMGNHMWGVLLTGFGQVDFIADPGDAPLRAVAGFGIMRRGDTFPGRRKCLLGTPLNRLSCQVILLFPDLP